MKKVFFLILYFILYITYSQSNIVFSSEELEKSKYYTEFNLLESYLIEHKQKIILFQEKYNIKDNFQLDILLNEIENLSIISQKIKYQELEWYNSAEISNHIIKRIKYINGELKVLLTQEKNKYQENVENKHKIYSNIWIKAGNYIITLIQQLANIVTQSDITTEKKMKIFIDLKNLENNSKKLIDFWKTKYENIEKIQEDFIFIIKEIREDMISIKEILKK